jgi:hypothetical protein
MHLHFSARQRHPGESREPFHDRYTNRSSTHSNVFERGSFSASRFPDLFKCCQGGPARKASQNSMAFTFTAMMYAPASSLTIGKVLACVSDFVCRRISANESPYHTHTSDRRRMGIRRLWTALESHQARCTAPQCPGHAPGPETVHTLEKHMP